MGIKRVICAGSLNFDVVYATERLPREHEKLRCKENWQQLGGSGANTAYWLTRLGIPTMMFGRVGSDLLGELCVSELQRVGVDTSLVQKDDNLPTGIATVLTHGAAKRMLTGVNANSALDECDELLSNLDESSHLHVSISNDELAVSLLQKAKTLGATTSCDFNGAQHQQESAVERLLPDELGRAATLDWVRRSLREMG